MEGKEYLEIKAENLEFGFAASRLPLSECRNERARVLALHLSRRDRKRADLSSDK
jgi:hypothetical protein